MAIMAKDEGGGKDFEPVPAGSVQAVCFGVWDIGLQESTWNGQTKRKHKIVVGFETTHQTKEGARMIIYKHYTLSLSAKANLSADLEGWMGKAFKDEERTQGFNVETLVGQNGILAIVHKESDGKTYANITGISPLMSGMEKITPEAEQTAPEWIQKKYLSADPVTDEPETDVDFDMSTAGKNEQSF